MGKNNRESRIGFNDTLARTWVKTGKTHHMEDNLCSSDILLLSMNEDLE